MRRAFQKWEKNTFPQFDSILLDNEKLQNVTILKSQIFSLQEELFVMSQTNEIATQLHAERAHNR